MNKILAAIILLLSSNSVFAYTGDFRIQNSFELVTSTFTKIALFFNDTGFLGLFISFFVIGILVSVISYFFSFFSGSPTNPASIIVKFLAGGLLFILLTASKGTITIYDTVTNQSSVISDIPDLILIPATLINSIEQGIIDIVDLNTAYPYKVDVAGLAYSLLNQTVTSGDTFNDHYLNMSIKDYWKKCAAQPLANGTVNANHILSGATNMLAELEKMKAINSFSTLFIDQDGDRGGNIVSCKDAFASIKTRVEATNSVENKLKSICSSAGFNYSVANELQSCKESLDWISEKVNLEGSGGDYKSLLTNTSLSSIILASMDEGNADSLYALRKLIISGKGDNNLVNEFMPVLQSGLFAISYMLIPFILLLVVTPLFKKSLVLTVGLIGLNSLWNISLAITNSNANESAIRFFDSLGDVHYGLNSLDIITASSIKALSVFSNYQTFSLMIAVFLLATLFGVSAYALTGLADKVDDNASRAFDEGAQNFNTDEGRSNYRDTSTTGLANNEFAKQHGNELSYNKQMLNNANEVGHQKGIANASGSDNIGDMTKTTSTIGEVNSTLSGLGAQDRKDAMTEKGDGDFVKGAGDITETSSYRETSQSSATQKRIDEFGADNLAELELAQTTGQFRGANGSPDRISETAETEFRKSAGSADAKRDVSEEQGRSVESIEYGTSKRDALTAVGTRQAQFDNEDYDAKTVQAGELGEYSRMGDVDKNNNIAKALGINPNQVAQGASAAGNVSMNLDSGSASAVRQRMIEAGVNPSAIDWKDVGDGNVVATMSANQAGVLTNASLNQNVGANTNHATTHSSGSSTNINNSTTDDSRNTTHRGTSTYNTNENVSRDGTSSYHTNENVSRDGTSSYHTNEDVSRSGKNSTHNDQNANLSGNWSQHKDSTERISGYSNKDVTDLTLPKDMGINIGFKNSSQGEYNGVLAANGNDAARKSFTDNIYNSMSSLQSYSESNSGTSSSNIGLDGRAGVSVGRGSPVNNVGGGANISGGIGYRSDRTEQIRNDTLYGVISDKVNSSFDAHPYEAHKALAELTKFDKNLYNVMSDEAKNASKGSGNNWFLDTDAQNLIDKVDNYK